MNFTSFNPFSKNDNLRHVRSGKESQNFFHQAPPCPLKSMLHDLVGYLPWKLIKIYADQATSDPELIRKDLHRSLLIKIDMHGSANVNNFIFIDP